jgi:fermentation-respiration switch protein FrsA (DUF1100 family)
VHGDDDHVVPIVHGRAVFDAVRGPRRFVTIRGGDHNDAAPSDPTTYWGAVSEFVDGLSFPSAPR